MEHQCVDRVRSLRRIGISMIKNAFEFGYLVFKLVTFDKPLNKLIKFFFSVEVSG